MLKTNEIAGEGNSFSTEFRQYDPRLGKWLSLDPLMEQFPWMSPFVGFDNNPILYVDPYGLESSTEGEEDKKKDDTKPTKKIVRPSDRKKQEEPRENDGMDGKAQEFIPEGAPEKPSDGDKSPSNNSQINYYQYDGEMNHWEGILNEATIHTKKSNNSYQGWKADYAYGQNWGQISGRKISYNQNELVQQYTNFGNTVIGGSFGMIGAVPAISYGILTAPVWAPYAWNIAKGYNNTIGMNGGYLSGAGEIINQSATQMSNYGNIKLGRYDLIGLSSSFTVTKSAKIWAAVQGVSSTFMSYSLDQGKGGIIFEKHSKQWIFGSLTNGLFSTYGFGKNTTGSWVGDGFREWSTGTSQGLFDKMDE